MNWPARALFVVILFAAVGTGLHSRAQTQSRPPSSARSRSGEMVDRWNDIGNKLIAMAQDFPEDKYDFKVQKDERTFALKLLHAAALNLVLIRRIPDQTSGPTSAKATILRVTLSRPKPTSSSSCRRPSPPERK